MCVCGKADDVQSLLQAAMPATQVLPVATKSALLMSPMLPVSPQSNASSPTYVQLGYDTAKTALWCEGSLVQWVTTNPYLLGQG